MAVLTGILLVAPDSGIVNPSISVDLDSYDIDNWPPHESELVVIGGGSVTYVSATPSINTVLTGAKVPGYFEDFYNRIHFNPAELNFGNITKTSNRTLAIWNSYLDESQLVDYDTTDSLVSISPSYFSMKPLAERNIVFSAVSGGLSNLNAIVSLNFLDKETIYVRCYGTRVALFPYQAKAQWQEVYEWKTDIITSYDGTEQRIKLRKAPRITTEATYSIPQSEKRKAQNKMFGWLANPWVIPLWTEALRISSVSLGVTSLTFDVSDTELLSGGRALIFKDATNWELINITTVVGLTLTLEEPTTASYSNAYLIPVRIGRINQGAVRDTDGYTDSYKLPFILEDLNILDPTIPTQYLGYDVDTRENISPNKGLISDNIVTRIDRIDQDVGVVDIIAPWTYNKIIRIYTMEMRSLEEGIAFKKWMYRRAGKFRPFWMPTFEPNFINKSTGLVTDSLYVEKSDYIEFAFNRVYIAIQLTDKTWRFTKIINAAEDVLYDILQFSDTLNIQASSIRLICFLTLKRLDSDRIEVNYEGNAISSASIRTIEIEPLLEE